MFCSHTIMSDAPLCAGDGETMILQHPASVSCPTQRVCLWLCFIHSLTVKQNYNSPENQDPTPQFTVKRWVSGLNLRTLLRVCVYMSLLACLHNPVWINMRWFMNKHGCEHTHTLAHTNIHLPYQQWTLTFPTVSVDLQLGGHWRVLHHHTGGLGPVFWLTAALWTRVFFFLTENTIKQVIQRVLFHLNYCPAIRLCASERELKKIQLT